MALYNGFKELIRVDLFIQYGVPVFIGLTLGLLILNFQKRSKVKVNTVDAETFKKNMRKGQLIDIRKDKAFETDKIKGARNFSYKYLKSKNQTKVRKDKPVYLYCDNGKQSKKAGKKLTNKGFQEVIVLEGGFNNYRQAYPKK